MKKFPCAKVSYSLSYPTAILHLHLVYSVFSDEALATALYADIHVLDYAV
jgi:hypothetical protein